MIDEVKEILIPAAQLPSFNVTKANANGVSKKLLYTVWGGLGDQVCAEPTLRYAIDTFRPLGFEIHLCAMMPSLFSHLDFDSIIPWPMSVKNLDEYFLCPTMVNVGSMFNEFVSHAYCHSVDYHSLCATRTMLPLEYKQIKLEPKLTNEQSKKILKFSGTNYVYIHAGKTWKSRTIPASFWNKLIDDLIYLNYVPVLIGTKNGDRSTVDVNTDGCIDARDVFNIDETIELLRYAEILITNDSAPLHLAAAGSKAHIGLISTAIRPDYRLHWRYNTTSKQNEFGYRQKAFGKSGMWEHLPFYPSFNDNMMYDEIDEATLETWLPDVSEITKWVDSIRHEV